MTEDEWAEFELKLIEEWNLWTKWTEPGRTGPEILAKLVADELYGQELTSNLSTGFPGQLLIRNLPEGRLRAETLLEPELTAPEDPV